MNLWKLRTYLEEVYSSHFRAVTIAGRIAAGFVVFFSQNSLTGYSTRFGNPLFLAALSAASGFFPGTVTLLAAAVLALFQLYSLSLCAFAAGVGILLILLLLYFGTVGGGGYDFLLTPAALSLGVPAAAPLVIGLTAGGSRGAGILCGTVWYFTLYGIRENAQTLAEAGEVASTADIQRMIEELSALLNAVLRSRRLILVLAALLAAWIVVWTARRMAVKYAWTAAVAAGILVYLTVWFAGSAMLELKPEILGTLLGAAAAPILALAVHFMCFWPDYQRTESLQFEDDDYYYYVKAVPKKKAPKRAAVSEPEEVSRQERRARRRPAGQQPGGERWVKDGRDD